MYISGTLFIITLFTNCAVFACIKTDQVQTAIVQMHMCLFRVLDATYSILTKRNAIVHWFAKESKYAFERNFILL